MATLLIINDHPAHLKVLVDLLRKQEHTILVATSGRQALDLLDSQLPDLILLDVMISDMGGFEVCAAIKQQKALKDIPIIFLTALADIEDKNRAFETGGVDFISKPFHEQEVLLRIQTHLTLHRQRMELEQRKETLRVTLRSIGDGVITTDIQGKIVFLNTIAEKLTGWSNNEAYGKHCSEVFRLVNERTGKECLNPAQKVLERGKIINLDSHTALITKKGTTIPIADSGAPIRDQQGKIIGVVIVFRDVSHETMLEEELLKSKKLESIGILAGGIAHDFNNILAAIMGNIDLAGYFLEEDTERAQELLQAAKKASKRAVKLTNQLLTFSRGGDPVKESSALPKIVSESADFVLQGSKVSCKYRFANDLWAVDIDTGQIGQVIQNIILNSIQAMPEGGVIEVQCDNCTDPSQEPILSGQDGDYVRIRIQDQGVGIPRQILDKIYDPYFSTKQLGNGLGLAICYSIIQKHDGYITTESPPGEGTTFTIYLPAIADTPIPPKTEKPAGTMVPQTRIMVMDDEEMILTLISAQLRSLGHTPIVVKHGEAAIETYEKLKENGTPAELVILDLTIAGGMGGEETAKQLLAIDPQVKLVVASGYSNDPVMADHMQYGFKACLSKPFDLNELKDLLSTLL